MNKMEMTKDIANKQLIINRQYQAPVDTVWTAFTDHQMLDRWWGPEPYRAETKSMDFREGGIWHYCMVGPEGQRQWCMVLYLEIEAGKRFVCRDNFCDENLVVNNEMPSMHWHTVFEPGNEGTNVTFRITFPTEEDLHNILTMGFEEGFNKGLNQLEQLLSKQPA